LQLIPVPDRDRRMKFGEAERGERKFKENKNCYKEE
jgi:hypothetical protein